MIRILIPTDFGDASINAITHGVQLAHTFPIEIHLLYCIEDFVIEPNQTIADVEREADKHFEMITQQFKQHKKLKIIPRVEVGYIEDITVEIANRELHDMIIIGTKSKDETIKEYLGSVTTDVIQKSHVPILVIPDSYHFNTLQPFNLMYITQFSNNDHFGMHQLIKWFSPFNANFFAIQLILDSFTNPILEEEMIEIKNHYGKIFKNQNISCKHLYYTNLLESIQLFVEQNKIDIIALTLKKHHVWDGLFHEELFKKILFHMNIPLFLSKEKT